jgi:glycosyltransferase involved in cell wall biosynthesis
MFHMLAPSPFRGYEGHFTGRFQFPRFNIVHYNLNQALYFRLIPKRATIITSNNYYKQILAFKCPGRKVAVLTIFAGADEYRGTVTKTYDLIWMGRFHAQKGLLEVPSIIERVKESIPGVRVAVVGDGENDLRKNLEHALKEKDLAANIEVVGFVVGDTRYRYLSQSRVFMMTSLYESLGLVNIEALRNGVPVVAYDLPVYDVFGPGMIKVRLEDIDAMAKAIVGMLTDPYQYEKASNDAREFAKGFTWSRVGEEVISLLPLKEEQTNH